MQLAELENETMKAAYKCSTAIAAAMAGARCDKRINPTAYRLLHEIAWQCELNGGLCWLTHEKLAESTATNPTNLSRWLKPLHELGYIEHMECRREGGGHPACIYYLTAVKEEAVKSWARALGIRLVS